MKPYEFLSLTRIESVSRVSPPRPETRRVAASDDGSQCIAFITVTQANKLQEVIARALDKARDSRQFVNRRGLPVRR